MKKASTIQLYYSKYPAWLHAQPAERRNEVQLELRSPEVHIIFGNGANHPSRVQAVVPSQEGRLISIKLQTDYSLRNGHIQPRLDV